MFSFYYIQKMIYGILLIFLGIFSPFQGESQILSDFDFSVKIFKEMLQSVDSSNVIFSPYALRYGLGMVSMGAQGNTQKQLGKVPELIHSKKYKWHVASRLWLQNGIPVKESFINSFENSFGFRPWFLDFTKAPDFITDRINGWMEEKTMGQIRHFMKDDSFPMSIPMMLTNAVYFKAQWRVDFEWDTDQIFYPLGKSSVVLPGMKTSGMLYFFENDQIQLFELPYQDPDLVLIIFLPKYPFSIKNLENDLIPVVIEKWIQQLSLKEIMVKISPFAITSTWECTDFLKSLGVLDAFSKEEANFSEISEKSGIYLGSFKHKVWLSVQRDSTEAAGSLIVPQVQRHLASSEIKVIEVNRPFFLGVRLRASHHWLFLGRFSQPF